MDQRFTNIPLLDERRIEHLLNKGTPDFIAEIVALFDERSQELLQKLNTSLADNSLSEMKKDLHSLKGISLTMGANLLGEICRQIDVFLNEGNLESGRDLIGLLPDITVRSIAAIRLRTNS